MGRRGYSKQSTQFEQPVGVKAFTLGGYDAFEEAWGSRAFPPYQNYGWNNLFNYSDKQPCPKYGVTVKGKLNGQDPPTIEIRFNKYLLIYDESTLSSRDLLLGRMFKIDVKNFSGSDLDDLHHSLIASAGWKNSGLHVIFDTTGDLVQEQGVISSRSGSNVSNVTHFPSSRALCPANASAGHWFIYINGWDDVVQEPETFYAHSLVEIQFESDIPNAINTSVHIEEVSPYMFGNYFTNKGIWPDAYHEATPDLPPVVLP